MKVGSFVKEEKYFFSSRWIIFFPFKPECLFVQNLNEKNMNWGEKKKTIHKSCNIGQIKTD